MALETGMWVSDLPDIWKKKLQEMLHCNLVSMASQSDKDQGTQGVTLI